MDRRYSSVDHMKSIVYCGQVEFSNQSVRPENIFSQICFAHINYLKNSCDKDLLIDFGKINPGTDELTNIVNPLNKRIKIKFSKLLPEIRKVTKQELKDYVLALHVFISLKGTDLDTDEFYNGIKTNFVDEISNECRLFKGYLIKSIGLLGCWWGRCYRYLNETEENMVAYRPGKIICWQDIVIAYKSCPNFQDFNCEVIIESITARKVEDVLGNDFNKFLIISPFTIFFVHEVTYDNDLFKLYLKEFPIGIENKVILWVDSNLNNESHENKLIFDQIMKDCPQIQFVLRDSTESGLEFLNSKFGKIKIEQGSEHFRIVTNMIRYNETDPLTAGARLVKSAIELGCKKNMMIFTSNIIISRKSLERMNVDQYEVYITSNSLVSIKFMKFKRFE